MIYSHLKKSRFVRTLLLVFNNSSLHRKIVLTYFFFVFILVGILAASIYTFTASAIRTQNTFSLQQGFNQASSYLTYKLNGISSSSDMDSYLGFFALLISHPPTLSVNKKNRSSHKCRFPNIKN